MRPLFECVKELKEYKEASEKEDKLIEECFNIEER